MIRLWIVVDELGSLFGGRVISALEIGQFVPELVV